MVDVQELPQPRPQGFSLKKWVGKALGTRLELTKSIEIMNAKSLNYWQEVANKLPISCQ